MGSFDLRTISIIVVIALIIGAGAGYMVGNSPVSDLIEEKDCLEAEYDSLYLAFQDLEAELNSTQVLLDAQRKTSELIVIKYINLLQEFIELEAEIASLQNATCARALLLAGRNLISQRRIREILGARPKKFYSSIKSNIYVLVRKC